MSYVVSFTDYYPEPRFDNVSWNAVRIEEAPVAAGPWTVLETIAVGVDVNPAEPSARSFTTELATLQFGWYRITWIDALFNQQPTSPVQNLAEIEWRPTLTDLATIDLARTRDSNGNILETFTSKTTPTDAQAQKLIDKAVQDLRPDLGFVIPADLIEDARNIVALRAAMYLELSFYGTEVAQNRSPYPEYKKLFDEARTKLITSIEAEEAGADPDNTLSTGNFPAFGFPTPSTWLDRQM